MNGKKNKKEVAVITIHGMGRADKGYYKSFEQKLRQKLVERWGRVVFEHIYYQDKLEPNEKFVYEKMKNAKTRFHSFILWRLLREFLIFYLADPGSLEYNKSRPMGPYYQTQARIVDTLRRVYARAGRNKNIKVIIVAHSLGCQVISSYIWDAQYSKVAHSLEKKALAPTIDRKTLEVEDALWADKKSQAGVWSEKGSLETLQDEDELEFLLLKNLYRFYTCGCNIPLFTAGHDYIVPFKKPNPAFKWLNFYSRNDVLGWPMQPLRGNRGAKDPSYKDHPTYRRLVEDHEIRAGNWLQFWNPLAHSGYLTDDNFIDPIVDEIKALIPLPEERPELIDVYQLPGRQSA